MKNINKKIAIILILLIIATIVLVSRFLVKRNNIEGVTRYDWINNLTTNFNMDVPENVTPYFKDVNEDSPYFDSVQTACEHGVLVKDGNFHGEKVATGEFVAITSMKAVGCYKVQIYLGLDEKPSDQDYINLALEKNIITEDQLKKGLTQLEAINVLSSIKNLYYYELWRDDYTEISYAKNVITIKKEDIVYLDKNCTEIEVSPSSLKNLNEKNVIVFENSMTNTLIARKISKIEKNGLITLKPAQMEEVINSYVVSDIESVSVSDIMDYAKAYQSKDNISTINVRSLQEDYQIILLGSTNWNSNENNENITVNLASEGNDIKIGISNGNSLVSYSLPMNATGKVDLEASISISNINVGVQMIHDGRDVKYANVQANANINVKGEAKLGGFEKKIPLFVAPVYLGNGTIGVEVPFYLMLTADGSISIEADIPTTVICEYSDEGGLRTDAKADCNVNLEADANVSCMFRIEPIVKLSLLGIIDTNILDAELDVGVEATASIIERLNSNIVRCADLVVAAPIIKVSVLGDDEAQSLLAKILSVGFEVTISDAENAWYIYNNHFETYISGEMKRVEKCTYGESVNILEAGLPHNYLGMFTSEFVEYDNYYEVHGRILDQFTIVADVAQKIQIGDTYTYDNHTLTVEDRNVYNDMEYILFCDDYQNHFLVDLRGDGATVGGYGETVSYYGITLVSPVDNSGLNGSYRVEEIEGRLMVVEPDKEYQKEAIPGYACDSWTNCYIEVESDYVFKIEKQNIITFIGNADGEFKSYTVEEIVNKNIADYDGKDFSKPGEILFSYFPEYGGSMQNFSISNFKLSDEYIGLDGQKHSF